LGKTVEIQERLDGFGVKSIYVSALLKGGEWLMVYKQASSDAFSDLHRTQAVALVLLLGGAVAIIAMAFWMSGKMVRRIAVSDKEKEIMNEQVIEAGKLASVGELAAGIAHEINNPVAIMVEEAGWIEDILGKDEPISEEDLGEIQRAVQMVRTQGDRCKEITYKLLSFARKTDSTIKTVNLNHLVEEVMGLLQQKSRFASVQIETDLDEHLPEVSASPSEMQQVLLNLMNNAVDAMDKQGGVIKVHSSYQGGIITLSVSDTGDGIPEANLSRIFDPFFTTKPVGKGTGLGLSIVYGIVEKMGGHIAVRSSVGHGTTFTVTLPVGGTDSPGIPPDTAASTNNQAAPEEEIL
jgi:two-component system NtrC family sensor kinase